jgi:hypothetical protein
MKQRKDIPDYFLSTIRMLDATYPSGVPEGDYYPLLRVFKDSGMSDRSVADVMTIYLQGDYTRCLYEVAQILPNKKIANEDVERVIAKLRPNGYEDWLLDE